MNSVLFVVKKLVYSMSFKIVLLYYNDKWFKFGLELWNVERV